MWIYVRCSTPNTESENFYHLTNQKSLIQWKIFSLILLVCLTSVISYQKFYEEDTPSISVSARHVHRRAYRPKSLVGIQSDRSIQPRDDGQVVMMDISGPLPNLGTPISTQNIVQDFAFVNSYNNPYIVGYIPPSDNFDNVRMTLNISSYGSQYDRLGRIYLGNTEIWRTSTAEPNGNNVTFGYIKDVTKYLALFKEDSQLTFDLGNIVDGVYTGPFIASITIDFYNTGQTSIGSNTTVAEIISQNTNPAGRIIGLAPSLYWTSPNDGMSGQIPPLSRNTTRAVVSVGASGNSGEEFWYTHLLDSYGNGRGTGGSGPSRFIEVYVDDNLAGVVDPYPVIYAGGFSPSIWAPVVGFKAFDVPIYEVDVTPFLPLFWNSSCTISLKVTNGQQESDADSTDQNWFISASLLLWQTDGVVGYGDITPAVSSNKAFNKMTPQESQVDQNSDIMAVVKNDYNIVTQSHMVYHSTSGGGNYQQVQATWKQVIHYSNLQNNTNGGNSQHVVLDTGFNNVLTVNGYPVVDSQKMLMSSLLVNSQLDESTQVSTVSIIRSFVESCRAFKLQCFQNGTSEATTQGNVETGGESTNIVSYQQLSLMDGTLFDREVQAHYMNMISDTSTTSNVGAGYASSMNGNQQYLSLADNLINQLSLQGLLDGASNSDYTSTTGSNSSSNGFQS